MNLMRFEKLVDDLARLDGTGKYATASNITAGDPYFARAIEAEYGQSITDLRKLVADEQKSIAEEKAPASTGTTYALAQFKGGAFIYADDGILQKRLRCDLAFALVDIFRDQLPFMFDEAELAGGRMRDRTSYTAKYQQMIQRSLELARQLGFATQSPATAPLLEVNVGGVPVRLSVAESRALLNQLVQGLAAYDAR